MGAQDHRVGPAAGEPRTGPALRFSRGQRHRHRGGARSPRRARSGCEQTPASRSDSDGQQEASTTARPCTRGAGTGGAGERTLRIAQLDGRRGRARRWSQVQAEQLSWGAEQKQRWTETAEEIPWAPRVERGVSWLYFRKEPPPTAGPPAALGPVLCPLCPQGGQEVPSTGHAGRSLPCQSTQSLPLRQAGPGGDSPLLRCLCL